MQLKLKLNSSKEERGSSFSTIEFQFQLHRCCGQPPPRARPPQGGTARRGPPCAARRIRRLSPVRAPRNTATARPRWPTTSLTGSRVCMTVSIACPFRLTRKPRSLNDVLVESSRSALPVHTSRPHTQTLAQPCWALIGNTANMTKTCMHLGEESLDPDCPSKGEINGKSVGRQWQETETEPAEQFSRSRMK